MKIENDLNFPEAYMKAIRGYDEDWTPQPERMSVTALIDSPYIRSQYIEKYDQLVVKAGDFFTGFLGTAMHEKLQKNCPPRLIAERKLTYKIGNIILVGKSDLENGGIGDYKLMSAWSWVFDKVKHFTEQLNILNYLRVKNGDPPAKFLRLFCFIKDWSEYQTRDKDYPQQRHFTQDLTIWPLEKTEEFINARLKIHADKNYRCSDEDKWVRVEGWAIKKKDRKSAVRVFDTPQECTAYIEENDLTSEYKSGIITLEERKSTARRCLDYCNVRSVCPVAKALREAEKK